MKEKMRKTQSPGKIFEVKKITKIAKMREKQ